MLISHFEKSSKIYCFNLLKAKNINSSNTINAFKLRERRDSFLCGLRVVHTPYASVNLHGQLLIGCLFKNSYS